MKRVVFIHGWEGHPDEGWRPWLKKELEKKGFEVINPAMPDTSRPTVDKWINHLTKVSGKTNSQLYLVGHSLGGITILRYLETLKDKQKIGGAILVSGFGKDLEYKGYKGEIKGFFKKPLDWTKIKRNCEKFIAIHSDDDKWVSVKNLELFKKKLGAETILMHGMKHFSGDDGITSLPIVLEKLIKISKSKKKS